MHKTILLIIFFAASFINTVNSQIEILESSNFNRVGQINRAKGDVPEIVLDISISKNENISVIDSTYVLRFYDMSGTSPIFKNTDTHRFILFFKNSNNAIELLYSTLLNVFTDERYKSGDYETILKIGTNTMIIRRDFYSAKAKVQCLVGDGMFFIKNEKELNQLFGK